MTRAIIQSACRCSRAIRAGWWWVSTATEGHRVGHLSSPPTGDGCGSSQSRERWRYPLSKQTGKVRWPMFALAHTEFAQHEFLKAFLVSGSGFLLSAVYLFLQLFKRRTFLRFTDWDERFSRRLGIPQPWTSWWRNFAQSKKHIILWSIFVGAGFAVACFSLCCYLIACQPLNQTPPNIAPSPPATAP